MYGNGKCVTGIFDLNRDKRVFTTSCLYGSIWSKNRPTHFLIMIFDTASLLRTVKIMIVILSSAMGQTSVSKTTKTTDVVLTAPLLDVERGDILSIHCEINNMKPGQEVVILKKNLHHGGVVKISSEDDVVVEDERIFVAKRQLHDGGVVYFLSIIQAGIPDGGEYYCKVTELTETGGTLDIAIKSVHVGIMHFPADPICTAPSLMTVHEGTWVTFNCSAGPANPAVSMTWTATGMAESSHHRQSETKSGEYTYSVLRFQARRTDNEAIYWCSIQSRRFPGKVKSCHVGPLRVIPSGDSSVENPVLIGTPPLDNSGKVPPVLNTDTTIDGKTDLIRCKVECDELSSNVFYWILSTIVISVIAFIFLIFGLVLIVKYCRVQDETQITRYSLPPQHYPHYPEQIYSEVEATRRGGGVVEGGEVKEYMALMKPAAIKNSIIMVQKDNNSNSRDHGRFEEHLAH